MRRRTKTLTCAFSVFALALVGCGDDDGGGGSSSGVGPGGDGGSGSDGSGGDDGSGGTGGTGGGDSSDSGDGGSGTGTGGTTDDTTGGSGGGTTGDTTDTTGGTTGTSSGGTTGGGTTGATTGGGTTGATTGGGTTGATTGGGTTGATTGGGTTGATTSSGAAGDGDDDGIPDEDDPFPNDEDLPGTTEQNLVYAHTSSTLFTMDPFTYAINQIGVFQWPADGGGHQMTDIAIDRYGVLYGVTFDRVYVCEPTIPQCYTLATLGTSFNAMTMVPAGTVLPTKDALIGISNAGGWYHMQLQGGAINPVLLGDYGGTYQSSGDAFSIEGVGTYATVDGTPDDVVIEVNPVNGTALAEIGTVTGYQYTYGLAGWEDAIFAFDESGDVLLIDPVTGDVTPVQQNTGHAWWGAGVRTVLPQ